MNDGLGGEPMGATQNCNNHFMIDMYHNHSKICYTKLSEQTLNLKFEAKKEAIPQTHIFDKIRGICQCEL